MRVLDVNILFLLGLVCIIALLQGPTHVEAVIGKNGEPVYASLNLKPGPPHKPGPGTLYTPIKDMKKPAVPSRLLKPGPPNPNRHLKPPPARPPHGRPAPPPRVQSLGIKPSGK
ncbi:uncharacterized protein LOC119402180 [Rhipicephalus sanguineus]|uniref:uncharacterized protein LOC119402180 n=1 Tax=Rhipicephalus sanguineus TaxID=34632 RepID=UPI001893CD8B|nr:uncharacterized protein LOC119402180 [Rhipicephalus sanguineus]